MNTLSSEAPLGQVPGTEVVTEAATEPPAPEAEAAPAVEANPLPPIETFHDVLVGPSSNREFPGVLWPDFENQNHARLWQRYRRICKAPTIDTSSLEIIEEPGMFVSMYDNHFGHMISETVPRLPQALAEFPDMPLYFTCDRPTRFEQTSGMFQAVMSWLNIPAEQVRFIHKPTLFRELKVAAQAEHLDGPPPYDGYLELLEKRIAGNLDWKTPEGITFVTRSGLTPQKGKHAAERYLVDLLRDLGVQIVRPEALSVREQMKIYAESKHLIFSEGSAAHGRQLLGRIDQSIIILRRRFRSHIALHQLQPRATHFDYVACFGGSLNVKDNLGAQIQHSMASLYNPWPVLEYFESIGVPLRKVWDMDTYYRLRDEDVLGWIRATYSPNIEWWLKPHNDDDYLLDQLEPIGLGHLRGEAQAAMQAHRPRAPQPVAEPEPQTTVIEARLPSSSPELRPNEQNQFSVLAARGEAGIDIFARITRAVSPADSLGASYRCIASMRGSAGDRKLAFYDPAVERHGKDLIRIAEAAQNDPLLNSAHSLFDPTGWPEARGAGNPQRLYLYHDFFIAWRQADGAVHGLTAQLARDPKELLASPDILTAGVMAMHDFNRLALARQVAGQLVAGFSAPLAEPQHLGERAEVIANALALLADLCLRAGEAGLAEACDRLAGAALGNQALNAAEPG